MTGEFAELDGVIERTRSYLRAKPEATGQDILVNLLQNSDPGCAMAPEGPDERRHCGRPVVLDGDHWTHLMPDMVATSQRGCHAAGWDWAEGREGGGDQSLAPCLVAAPESH